jgi:hypothetical protein
MHGPHQFETDFITHSCEQVLRFSRAEQWNDLSEERKVQLGFNMGVIALGLQLTKEESFLPLSDVRIGALSMQQFRERMRALITRHGIPVDEAHIAREF